VQLILEFFFYSKLAIEFNFNQSIKKKKGKGKKIQTFELSLGCDETITFAELLKVGGGFTFKFGVWLGDGFGLFTLLLGLELIFEIGVGLEVVFGVGFEIIFTGMFVGLFGVWFGVELGFGIESWGYF